MKRLGIVLFVAACGGGGGSSTGPATVASATEPCRLDCERTAMCNPDTMRTVDECTMECAMEVAGWARQDALETIFECEAMLTCTQDEDQCLSMVQPLSIHKQYEERCRMQMATCFPDDPNQIEGLCEVDANSTAGGDAGVVRFFAPVVMEEMIACMDAADCTARLNCIEGVVTKYHIDL